MEGKGGKVGDYRNPRGKEIIMSHCVELLRYLMQTQLWHLSPLLMKHRPQSFVHSLPPFSLPFYSVLFIVSLCYRVYCMWILWKEHMRTHVSIIIFLTRQSCCTIYPDCNTSVIDQVSACLWVWANASDQSFKTHLYFFLFIYFIFVFFFVLSND